jgi:hypothetical protein
MFNQTEEPFGNVDRCGPSCDKEQIKGSASFKNGEKGPREKNKGRSVANIRWYEDNLVECRLCGGRWLWGRWYNTKDAFAERLRYSYEHEEELERIRSGLAECGPSCAKHRLMYCCYGECDRCGGKFMFAKWHTKKEAAEYERKEQEKEERVKMRREEQLKREYDKMELKHKAKQNVTRVVLKVPDLQPISMKISSTSPEAVYKENKKATMTEDKKTLAKEKNKLRKRKQRKEESEYETTEGQKIAGAARTDLWRSKMDKEKKEKAKEISKLAMRENRKRKKEEMASKDGYSYTPRNNRKHPITRNNVRRDVRYIKDTGACEELINYFNKEKQEWLYMNPSGVHYRKLHYDIAHLDDDDDYEIVDLDNKDYMDLLVTENK